jgi:hypothetical protein
LRFSDVEIDVAGAHDGGGVLVVDQGEQQMFEGGVFVAALVGEGESPVKGLLRDCARMNGKCGL